MANDRNRSEGMDPTSSDRQGEMIDEPMRGGATDDVRSIADEGDEEFEDTEDLEDEEDSDEM